MPIIEIISTIGMIIDLIGKLLISYTAMSVHSRVRKEHKIDDVVFNEMKKEQIVGFIGITLMVVGFFLEVLPKFYY